MKKQFVGLLTSRGLASALQAVALVLLARMVTVADFGVVSVITSSVGIVLVVSGWGLAIYVPQIRARGEHDMVAAALRLNSLSTVWSAVVLSAGSVAWISWRHGPIGAAVIGVSLTLERNVETYLGVSIADGDSRTTAISIVVRRAVALAVFGALVWAGLEPVWSYCLGLLAGAGVAQLHIRRVVRGLPGDPRAVPLRTVGALARPYMIANVSAQLRTLDVSVVAAVLPTKSAGLYAAASKLVQPLLLVPQSIAAIVAPRSTSLSARQARSLAGKLGLAFAAALVLGSPAIIWAEPLVTFVMGRHYAGAGPALAWSLAGLPLLAVSSTFVAILQGQGRERAAATNAAVFGVLLLVFVAVGAARWGVAGAAAGLSLSYALRVIVLVGLVLRLHDVPKVTSDPLG